MSKSISLAGATYSKRYSQLTLKNKLKAARDWLLLALLIVAISACLFYSFDGIVI